MPTHWANRERKLKKRKYQIPIHGQALRQRNLVAGLAKTIVTHTSEGLTRKGSALRASG